MKLVPRRVSRSIDQLRRDLTMVTNGFRGRKPPPFTTRLKPVAGASSRDDASSRAASVLAPRTVRVAKAIRETRDAVSLVLEDPTGAPFQFVAGQFFTLLVSIDGAIVRRAYSASSDPVDGARVSITVKRVAGGLVSNHVNDRVREGDVLQVLGPSGSFVVEPREGAERHLVLLAGGSGITPMMAIARSILAREPRSRVTLVYGNRSIDDVIFRGAIDELAQRHGARFHVRHVLQHPPAEWAAHQGGRGVLEQEIVAAELEALSPDDRALYFICGPEPMMRAARAALTARRVPDANVLEERFTQPHLRVRANTAPSMGPQLLTIRANGAGVREIYVAPDQTILEAGLGTGLKMDYSCAMGGCAACKVRLCDGDVEMEEPNCLTSGERDAGYVLACVARMKGPATIALASDPSFAEPVKGAAE